MEQETKICTKCGQELPITDFYWRNKAKGLRRSDCKYCHCGYVKKKYQERHQEIEAIKSTLSCKKCGDSRFYVLDFHHINPEDKEDAISKMLKHNVPFDKIETEIDKCIPLCANCHREFHYLEKEEGIDIDTYLSNE